MEESLAGGTRAAHWGQRWAAPGAMHRGRCPPSSGAQLAAPSRSIRRHRAGPYPSDKPSISGSDKPSISGSAIA